MSTEHEVARPRGTPWNEINRLTAENARLRAALETAANALRTGAPEVIGYERGGLREEGFRFGWNTLANRLWQIVGAYAPVEDEEESVRAALEGKW